jgi:hypothetical protein
MDPQVPAERTVPLPPEGQRGMILMMTLLMLTILAVLGSGAVMRTSLDLREGGAQRIETAAYQLSEAGTLASVGLAAQMQGGFADFAAGKAGSTLTINDMGAGMLQLTGTDGSFGQELASVGGVDFSAKVYPPDLSGAASGYDAGRYCFQTYRVVTTSQIGTVKATTLREVPLQGQTALAAQVTVGPILCNP